MHIVFKTIVLLNDIRYKIHLCTFSYFALFRENFNVKQRNIW